MTRCCDPFSTPHDRIAQIVASPRSYGRSVQSALPQPHASGWTDSRSTNSSASWISSACVSPPVGARPCGGTGHGEQLSTPHRDFPARHRSCLPRGGRRRAGAVVPACPRGASRGKMLQARLHIAVYTVQLYPVVLTATRVPGPPGSHILPRKSFSLGHHAHPVLYLSTYPQYSRSRSIIRYGCRTHHNAPGTAGSSATSTSIALRPSAVGEA